MVFYILSSGTIDIISSSFRNVVRVPEFFFFFLIFLLFYQFSYQEDIFLISSKTSNILKTNTCSKEHSYLFPNNLNAFKVNKNNNNQWASPQFQWRKLFSNWKRGETWQTSRMRSEKSKHKHFSNQILFKWISNLLIFIFVFQRISE